jgi:hypothetical protein
VSQFEIFTVVRPVNVAAAGFAQGFSNFPKGRVERLLGPV